MTQPVLLAPRLSNVERLFRIPDVELLDLSSDGRTGLVLSNQTGSYQLGTVPATGGPVRPLSHGKERVAWARISHDSQHVVFTRDFGGREEHQFFRVPLAGPDEEEQITKIPATRVFDFN